jgi:hypothetical protein
VADRCAREGRPSARRLGVCDIATGQVERDGAPRRCRQLIDFDEQAFGAPAQRHKGDPGGIQLVEPFVSRELGIEYEALWQLAMLTLPELDQTEDFLGLLTFANVGVRVAEHLTVGVLGEEREDAGLTATAPRQIVGFDHRVFADIGHGVEIEVDRLPLKRDSPANGSCHRASSRETFCGVIREEYSDRKLFFGMTLSPQNSARPLSATKAMIWLFRSMAHSFRASEARKACAAGIARACEFGVERQGVGVQAHQFGDEQEQPPNSYRELARREREAADVGDCLGAGPGYGRTLLVDGAEVWQFAAVPASPRRCDARPAPTGGERAFTLMTSRRSPTYRRRVRSAPGQEQGSRGIGVQYTVPVHDLVHV